MLNVRKPKARTLGSRGFTINTKEDNITHSPVTDDSYENPFISKTPGSDGGSAFEPIGPPRIQRKVRVEDPITSICATTLDRSSFATPKRSATKTRVSKGNGGSPCDTTQTQATSLHSHASQSANERQKKGGNWGKSTSFKNQIKQIKMNLPKALKSMNRSPSKKSSIDLADLAVATICIVPRHGAGIAVGRRPFERMRTSLMLHMVQENQNASWEKEIDEDMVGDGMKKGKAQIAKLNSRLRNCIANEESCFVEKSQETVRLSKDTLEELNESGKSSLAKNDLGQRNLTCVKFLSSMYREVISDEKKITSHDGLSLMVIGSAYYALGKFEQALSVYQRAGIELKKKISTSPEYTVHCAKLFNNMGCVYFEMNKYEKAMQTFQRALELFHNDNEDSYASWIAAILDQASTMNNMAYMLIKFKQYDDASDLVDASFELQQMVPGNTGKTMSVSTLSTMAYIYYRTKNYKLSLDTYTACVQLQDKNAMYNESDQVEVLKKMTDICKKIKDHEKRIYLLRTVLVYQQCYLLEDDDEIWETNAAMADSLQAFADSGGTCI
mmetsp:Transcript_13557/g.29476  ORF Transcript_13557/g.29476 Transcript_13557/m.29476 type:complete len:556 (-) Transcript_13557:153-1820(-)|eukprot:CAMPEP_0172321754 /NCGR_PEP_ID=MMETSP1058-20130122/44221_1 /TAXON_ID=83371 /ORGANISM="Detonula confervacea, Strain CCMP 353" /LENGTH=555 /DNA_ID=CAMNT_0013037347 /DNA_START=23 /DNA_END=1690 /DNA_ORIENTATION=+